MELLIFAMLAGIKLMESRYGSHIRQWIYEKCGIWRIPRHAVRLKEEVVSTKALAVQFFIFLLTYISPSICSKIPNAPAFIMAAILIFVAFGMMYIAPPENSCIGEILSVILTMMILIAFWTQLLLLFIRLKEDVYPFYAAIFSLLITFNVLKGRYIQSKYSIRYFMLWLFFLGINIATVGYSFGIYNTIHNEILYEIFSEMVKQDAVLAHMKIVYVGLYWSMNGNLLTQGGQLLEVVAREFNYEEMRRFLSWGIIILGVNMCYYLRPCRLKSKYAELK